MPSGGQLLRTAVVAGAASALLAGGVAFAGSLSVTSQRLTTYSAASSIPPSTCTLAPAADSYVDQLMIANNFGSSTELDVQSAAVENRRTFVRFDLASCSIPSGAEITAATLELFLFTAPSASRTYQAFRVTSSWTEAGITWLVPPSVAASATTSTGTGTTSNVTLSWDVAADVEAFVGGTQNFGWQIRDSAEDAVLSQLGKLRSREWGTASERPVLDISYYP